MLYNPTTHETLTPSDIEAGATAWMLLDQTRIFQHPDDPYHSGGDGFLGGHDQGWTTPTQMTTTNPGTMDYNTTTHETLTPSDIEIEEPEPTVPDYQQPSRPFLDFVLMPVTWLNWLKGIRKFSSNLL